LACLKLYVPCKRLKTVNSKPANSKAYCRGLCGIPIETAPHPLQFNRFFAFFAQAQTQAPMPIAKVFSEGKFCGLYVEIISLLNGNVERDSRSKTKEQYQFYVITLAKSSKISHFQRSVIPKQLLNI